MEQQLLNSDYITPLRLKLQEDAKRASMDNDDSCRREWVDPHLWSQYMGEAGQRLVFETFDKAVGKFPHAKPVFHSDRGFQYMSKTFRAKLDRAGMQQSMSRAGRCIDNGPMEGFWGILKSEMYYLRKFDDYRSLRAAIENYIDFYNHRRYQKRLKCMAPMEYIEAMAA